MRISKITTISLLSLTLSLTSIAQEEKSGFALEGYGWVGGQYYYDTRQVVGGREGYWYSYPKPIDNDANGIDLNGKPFSNFSASITRIGLKVYSPDVLGAKVMGLMETDFTGPDNATFHTLRLRHAYLTMDWGNTKVLAGHYWNTFFVPEMIPMMQDLHNGGPFNPFSRTNQIRLDQKFAKNFKAVASIGWQRDYSSIGVNGRSPMNQIKSNIPECNLQLQYNTKNWFLGVGGEYKAIKPRDSYHYSLSNNNNLYSVDKLVHSYGLAAFANYKNDYIDIKFHGVYGTNLNDYLMLGGFVESDFDNGNKYFDYTTTRIASTWLDFSYIKGKWQPSLFLGYQKNLGYDADFIVFSYYGTGADIDNVFRIAPRIDYFATKNFYFTIQAEYTAAAYGKWDKQSGDVNNAKYVGNFRFSGAFCYMFNTGKRYLTK